MGLLSSFSDWSLLVCKTQLTLGVDFLAYYFAKYAYSNNFFLQNFKDFLHMMIISSANRDNCYPPSKLDGFCIFSLCDCAGEDFCNYVE